MNRAENEAGNKAIDSLINYETVKVNNYKIKKKFFFIILCLSDLYYYLKNI